MSKNRPNAGVFSRLSLAFLLVIIVFPNSFRELKLGLLLLVAPYWALQGFKVVPPKFWVWFGLFAVVHILGCIQGYFSSGGGFLPYVLGAYVVAPVVWALAIGALLSRFDEDEIGRMLMICFGCVAAQIILYFLFYDYIPSAVKFALIETPNRTYIDGAPALRLHAIVSLIFLWPYALYYKKKSLVSTMIVFLSGLVAAVLSGRTAILVAGGGCLIGMTLIERNRRLLAGVVFCLVLVAGFSSLGPIEKDFSWGNLVMRHAEKTLSGGGDERVQQSEALWRGFLSSPLIGVGHGVPAGVIRNDDMPWRYELIYNATLFRVGIIGFLVSVSLVGAPIVKLGLRCLRGKASTFQTAVFAGAIAFIIATATNPYVEGFELQWVLLLPIFLTIMKNKKRSGAAAA